MSRRLGTQWRLSRPNGRPYKKPSAGSASNIAGPSSLSLPRHNRYRASALRKSPRAHIMFAKLVKIHKSIVNDVYYTNVTYRCPLVVSLLVYFSNDISGNPVWAIRVGSLRLHINGILYSRFISSASAPTNSQNLSNFIITT